MKRALLAGSALLLLWGSAAADDGLFAGFAEADITPAVGNNEPVYLAGFGKNRTAKGVHDRLKVRAIVLKHGEKKIAFACADLVGLFHESTERIRKRLSGFSYVLVSCTHNHEGPDTMGLWGPTLFQSGIDDRYLAQVEDQFVQAIQRADKGLTAVSARIGTRAAPDLVRDNREPYVKHDELVALQFKNADNKNIGLLVQWNCHPETLDDTNRLVSADFVTGTVGHLQKKFGCPVVYLTGTVGGLMTSLGLEVKDKAGKALQDGTFEKTLRYGELVGRCAEQALAEGQAVELTPFVVRSQKLFLPLDNQMFKLAWALGVLKRQGYKWSGDLYRAEPTGLDVPADQRVCVATEIGWLRLGDLQVAAMPGEIYPELVLGKVQDPADPAADFPDAAIEPAIYSQMKSRYRMIVGLANDEIGYILPKRQWDEKRPYCYGRTRAQYGEINSVGPEAGPTLCAAFRDLNLFSREPKATGFQSLFNGKDLANWKGQIDEDPRRVAKKLAGLSAAERKQKELEANQKTFEHWVVQDGMIHYTGQRGIGNIETRSEFGDFELYLDWKITARGDSGIFLRSMPQVQIWDPLHQKVGSGGLYNNKKPVPPLKTADKPAGEWNTFHIKMVGEKVWIDLNGERVIDGAVQDNYWSDFQQPAPPRGPIVLQSHGTPLWFRNIHIRELSKQK